MGEQFGRYQLEELIGRGGMGEVHRAVDTTKNRVVAVKRLPADLAQDAAFRARFRRESELAARLDHPHVIPIHDYGEIDGRMFIEMRLVRGADLAMMLDGTAGLDPARALRIVTQTAGALDAAHAIGLVHRDVKPSNILVASPEHGSDEFTYLVDFGIARAVDASSAVQLTATGATSGTVAYMAPERVRGESGDHRVDVYALACVLFEALTGRRPFTADELPALVYAHLTATPPRVSEVRPGLPAALDDVVARGMAKDPADRYAHAGELARAATAVLGPVTAPYDNAAPHPSAGPTTSGYPAVPPPGPGPGSPNPPPPGRNVGSPPGRRRTTLVAIVAGVAVAVVLLVVAVVALVRPDRTVPVAAPPPTTSAAPAPPTTLPPGASRIRNFVGPRACDILAADALSRLGLGAPLVGTAPKADGECSWDNPGNDQFLADVNATDSTMVTQPDSVLVTVGGMQAERHFSDQENGRRSCIVTIQVETAATIKLYGPTRPNSEPEADTCAQPLAAADLVADRVR